MCGAKSSFLATSLQVQRLRSCTCYLWLLRLSAHLSSCVLQVGPAGRAPINILTGRQNSLRSFIHLTALKHHALNILNPEPLTSNPSLEHAIRSFCKEFCQAGAEALHGLLCTAPASYADAVYFC